MGEQKRYNDTWERYQEFIKDTFNKRNVLDADYYEWDIRKIIRWFLKPSWG